MTSARSGPARRAARPVGHGAFQRGASLAFVVFSAVCGPRWARWIDGAAAASAQPSQHARGSSEAMKSAADRANVLRVLG